MHSRATSRARRVRNAGKPRPSGMLHPSGGGFLAVGPPWASLAFFWVAFNFSSDIPADIWKVKPANPERLDFGDFSERLLG